MGEKEAGLAGDEDQEGERRMHHPKVLVEKELGRGTAAGAEGSGAGGEPMEASNLNLSKSNINRTTIGDPDFDLAAQKKMPERDKDVSQ